MDFTLKKYGQILKSLLLKNYSIITLKDYFKSPKDKVVILRHDVDRLPKNAKTMAEIEYSLGIRATYNFRIIPSVFDENIISDIVSLNHELAYHYEDLTIKNGKFEEAIEHFQYQLDRLREYYPIRTICMHGSPLSNYDNRSIWKKYDYRDFDVIAEPYFDIDFNEILYLTDTGRSWNNNSVSVRDKVDSKFNYNFKSTQDLIDNIELLPDKIMINTHPQRWTNNPFLWTKELVWQNVKNVVKRIVLRRGQMSEIRDQHER